MFFNFDEKTSKFYFNRSAILAASLNQKLGYDIYGISRNDGGILPIRCVLIISNDNNFYLDIIGVRTLDQICSIYNFEVIIHKIDEALYDNEQYHDIDKIDNNVNKIADLIIQSI